ncbi:MAG TPA: alanine--tRNA ligase, partial [Candidatus Dormibacteraeota bacterium]|nr:alanine--tRNA ligase [Candidatus Dormibacteraeota bacterium]
SFGDYYKSEAIAFAWEFVTRVLHLDPERLYVTVHTNDDDAEGIWREEIGLAAARITRFDEDNFWTMGATGPCGPSTEIFYDIGEKFASGPEDVGPNLGNRYVEIWNVVFQQFNRDQHGVLHDLPRKSIDTGAGLERMLAAVNGKGSMYETDLFLDLVAAQPSVRSQSIGDAERRVRQNIIADHARAVTFLINDGVYPSNNDRGYVLRFLIRRAIRNGRLLGYPDGFLAALVPAVVDSLEGGYPELRNNATRIAAALEREERTFNRTLERGLAVLDRMIEEANDDCTRLISGEDAFTLHDTHGFPIELSREIAAEHGVAIDTAAFELAMSEQRERARKDAASKRATISVSELPAVKSVFTGYDALEGNGTILAMLDAAERPIEILENGAQGRIVLDSTSFYAERGGQIGDRGILHFENARFDVEDTQYLGDAIVHIGRLRSGELRVGNTATTSVHDWWRREIRRHHTSAHLLQRALRDILGDDVAQAGSWVGIDRMRFDFRWSAGALSAEQRRAVAHRVNEMIRDDTALLTKELPIEEAKRTGAIWMFGEKYGESVRVVQAGPSVEFCGGTHSHSTGELGLFVILGESSIGSGVRRIESCVSEAAENFVGRQQEIVGEIAGALAGNPDELGERVTRLQREVRDLQGALEQLKARLAAADAAGSCERAEGLGARRFIGAVVPEANAEALRHLSAAIRTRMPNGTIALVGVDGDQACILVVASADAVASGVHSGNLVKLAAPFVEGKGGGQAAHAQGGGKAAGGAHAALAAMRSAVVG